MRLQGLSTRLRLAGGHIDKVADAIQSVRFCRNVQRSEEAEVEENARRLRQLLEAVDRLLAL